MSKLLRRMIQCSTHDKGVGPYTTAEEVLTLAEVTDLIEFKRETCIHWGMYVGFDSVIHLMNLGDGVGKVEEELLVDVAQGGKCRINNKSGKIDELKSLEGFDPTRSAELIIEEARKWIYPEQSLEYNLLSNNCEHLCMKWKYGVSKSEQVEKAALLLGAAAGGVAGTAAIATVAAAVADAAADAAKQAAEEEARAKAEEEKAKAAEKLKSSCVIA